MPDWKQGYKIKYIGLKTGFHDYRFELGKEFFDHFEYSSMEDSNIVADVRLEKLNNMMTLVFHLEGTMNTLCDRCQDPICIPLEFDEKLIVKFGEETGSTEDDILVLGPAEYELDLTQYLYEYAQLSAPGKRAHQHDEDCNQEFLDHLYRYQVDEEEEETDPRWDQLKKLK